MTVVDQQGRLLSSPNGANAEVAEREKQMEIARELEDRYTQRVQQLLAPLVGTDRVRAQVVADVEMSTTEEAREQYRPESQIVRSEQTSEETSRTGVRFAGRAGCVDESAAAAGHRVAAGYERDYSGSSRRQWCCRRMRTAPLASRRRTTRPSSRLATTRSIARWLTPSRRRVV